MSTNYNDPFFRDYEPGGKFERKEYCYCSYCGNDVARADFNTRRNVCDDCAIDLEYEKRQDND